MNTASYGLTAHHRTTLRETFPVALHVAPRTPRARRTVLTALVSAAVLAAALSGVLVATAQHGATLLPCSTWASTSAPKIPAGAYVDRCDAGGGAVSWSSGLTTTHGPTIASCAMGSNFSAQDVRSDVCDGNDGHVYSSLSGAQLSTY